jgi:hypothetical protein
MKSSLILKFFPALATGLFAIVKSSSRRKDKRKRRIDPRVKVPLAGTVKSRKQDKSFVYLQISAHDGDWWVGVPESDAQVGDLARCVPYRMIAAYDSAELMTGFEKMYFADSALVEKQKEAEES